MLIDPADLGKMALETSTVLFRQKPGSIAEPLEHAWRRLFNEAPSNPMLFCVIPHKGRDIVVRFYSKGRLQIGDPAGGHQIRVLDKSKCERVLNALTSTRKVEPRPADAALRWVAGHNP